MFEIWFERFDLHSYCLSAWEIYLKIWKTFCKAPLWYAKVLSKPNDDTSWKPFTHMLLVFALSFVKLLWPSREIFVMLSWSRFTCTPHTLLLCFYEKLALYHPSIPQNKCSTICVGLSLKLLLKKWGIGYQKKIWTLEDPSIKKKKKREPMNVLEKKSEKEEERKKR